VCDSTLGNGRRKMDVDLDLESVQVGLCLVGLFFVFKPKFWNENKIENLKLKIEKLEIQNEKKRQIKLLNFKHPIFTEASLNSHLKHVPDAYS